MKKFTAIISLQGWDDPSEAKIEGLIAADTGVPEGWAPKVDVAYADGDVADRTWPEIRVTGYDLDAVVAVAMAISPCIELMGEADPYGQFADSDLALYLAECEVQDMNENNSNSAHSRVRGLFLDGLQDVPFNRLGREELISKVRSWNEDDDTAVDRIKYTLAIIGRAEKIGEWYRANRSEAAALVAEF